MTYSKLAEHSLQVYVDISIDSDSSQENGYAPPMREPIAEPEILRANPAPVPTDVAVGSQTETDSTGDDARDPRSNAYSCRGHSRRLCNKLAVEHSKKDNDGYDENVEVDSLDRELSEPSVGNATDADGCILVRVPARQRDRTRNRVIKAIHEICYEKIDNECMAKMSPRWNDYMQHDCD